MCEISDKQTPPNLGHFDLHRWIVTKQFLINNSRKESSFMTVLIHCLTSLRYTTAPASCFEGVYQSVHIYEDTSDLSKLEYSVLSDTEKKTFH